MNQRLHATQHFASKTKHLPDTLEGGGGRRTCPPLACQTFEKFERNNYEWLTIPIKISDSYHTLFVASTKSMSDTTKTAINTFHFFFIGLCALGMLRVSCLMHQQICPWGATDVFIYAATIFGYHFTHHNKRLRAVAWALGMLGAATLFFFGAPFGWSLLLPPIAVWLGYYGVFWPQAKGFRDVPLSKPITISYVWAWVTVVLPLAHAPAQSLIWLFASRFCFIFALALAYDSTDSEKDRRTGFRTLSSSLGTKGTIRAVVTSLWISGICTLGTMTTGTAPPGKTAGVLVSLLLTGLGVATLLKKNRWPPWQKSLIDAPMVLQWLLVCSF